MDHNMSILVVEDDPAACKSLVNLLGMQYPRASIHWASNGHKGLQAFHSLSPEIVITDIRMPVIDGIAMSEQMKLLRHEVAIIALTSYTDSDLLLKAIEIGIDHYLPKPLVCEKLFEMIDRIHATFTAESYRKSMEDSLRTSQAALTSANDLLEQRVSDKTEELQRTADELESFCYTVSHDLRAPLRHINSYCSILSEEFEGKLPGYACEYLDRIRNASSRMGSLIDYLLELSRVGRSRLELKTVDLSDIAAKVLAAYQETEQGRCVKTQVTGGLTAMGDQTLLRQLLENLLGNAWKYTSHQPQPKIEFGATTVSGKPAFFVKDNGVGFSMEYKNSLFVPFQRLRSDFEGYGIGLATAKRIVQRHGGEIWCEAKEGRGATFYFTLPGFPEPAAGPADPLPGS